MTLIVHEVEWQLVHPIPLVMGRDQSCSDLKFDQLNLGEMGQAMNHQRNVQQQHECLESLYTLFDFYQTLFKKSLVWKKS